MQLALSSPTGLSPAVAGFSKTVRLTELRCAAMILQPRNCRNNSGLGSCAFARHYLRNHCCFLFLRVLRCFSSPGWPRALRGAAYAAGCPIRTSVLHSGYLPLGTAFRSLSRPSSPPRAKASFMCPFLLSVFFRNESPFLRRHGLDRGFVCRNFLGCLRTFCVGIELPASAYFNKLPLSLVLVCLDSFDLLVFVKNFFFTFQYVNVLVCVVPGRVELPTSTLSV